MVCSALFGYGGSSDPTGVGGLIFIVLGVIGVLGFGTVLVVALGHLLGRRPPQKAHHRPQTPQNY